MAAIQAMRHPMSEPVAAIPYAADFIADAGLADATHQQAVRQLVADLLAAGLLHRTDRSLSKLKVWYPVVGGTLASHAVNLVAPSTFALQFVGSPTHSLSGGIAWNGVNQYADTGYSVAHDISYLPPNGAALHYYSLDNTPAGDVYEIGAYDNWQFLLSVQSGYLADAPFGRAYSGNTDIIGTGADGRGLFSLVRGPSDATVTGAATLYRNAVPVASGISGGYATAAKVYIGALNIGDSYSYGPSPRRCAGAGISEAFTPAEQAAFYQAVQTFNTILTRAV